MQPQAPKSIGGALVEVFDAALSLIKTELRSLSRRVGNIIKAKGIGVVLLLASVVPLSLALIFLILFVFYGLIRLGLGAWAAALIIALVSLAATGLLILLGIRRLTAEVPQDPDDASDPARAEQRAEKKLDKAETALEKQNKAGEKRVEKAERDLERAQAELGRAGGAANRDAVQSGTNPSTNAAAGNQTAATTHSETVHSETARPDTMRPETMRAETIYVEPRPPSRPAEDGIPVSTKPQLGDEEDRR